MQQKIVSFDLANRLCWPVISFFVQKRLCPKNLKIIKMIRIFVFGIETKVSDRSTAQHHTDN